jgi:hypothetical protein
MKISSGYLFERVDNSQLVLFRMAFGALMALESWGAIGTGWVKRAFLDTQFTFTFIGFEWLSFLHGEMMYAYYIVMGIFGVFVMLGFKYRLSSIILFIMWTATYLLQKTSYNNHYYLVVLLSAFMAVVPAHTSNSLDSRKSLENSEVCPRWSLLVFQVQVAIVYFYAAVAKVYPDWLKAIPTQMWLSMKRDYFLIGGLLQEEWLPYFISYGGILFDAMIIPGLLWKKTRPWAFGISIFFHLFNSAVFQVGIFPYLMVAISAFFFPIEQVRKIFFKHRPELRPPSFQITLTSNHRMLMGILGVYFIVQIILPIRHHFFQGNVFWTEEGHRMSWRMMLRSKSGGIDFMVVDHQKKDTTRVIPTKYLSSKQGRVIATRPDMAWQFVQFLKSEIEKEGVENYSIYANSWARLNKRKSAPLISPEVDLAKVKWKPFQHSDWLMPMPNE